MMNVLLVVEVARQISNVGPSTSTAAAAKESFKQSAEKRREKKAAVAGSVKRRGINMKMEADPSPRELA